MRWIVVDGIDGSGKSTYAGLIEKYYQDRGEKVTVHIHPSSGMFGRVSRRALESRGTAMHAVASVFFIADVLRSLSMMKREAGRFDTVVFVRYIMATAYLPDSLAPLGYGLISKLLPVPERLLLIDIDPATAYQRISDRSEKTEMFEDPASLEKARKKLLSLASRGWKIIDNSAPVDQGREQLFRLLDDWDRSCR